MKAPEGTDLTFEHQFYKVGIFGKFLWYNGSEFVLSTNSESDIRKKILAKSNDELERKRINSENWAGNHG